MYQLIYERTIPLWHSGQCRLLGVTAPPHHIYVEETYGEGNWVAQVALDREGNVIAVADEARGENPDIAPLPLPNTLKAPGTGWISMALNIGGLPARGLVHEEQIQHLGRPLKTLEKEALITHGLLPAVPLPSIIGMVGSYVVSEAKIERGVYLLVRQLKVAVKQDETLTAEDGTLYDYVTYDFPIVQTYLPNEPDRSLHHALVDEAQLGVMLTNPTDLIIRDDLLVITDAGEDGRVSTVNIWHIHLEPPPSEEERLYGSMDS